MCEVSRQCIAKPLSTPSVLDAQSYASHLADRTDIEGALRSCEVALLERLLPAAEISQPIGSDRPTAVRHRAQLECAKQSIA